ncbi:FliA/WhiG family RNA polymerase sigma factor [Mycolicibacterium aurum]|uniref:FliA/WhiG family RNA polymerase sigma factor n=1 Tax=Mycolicibacterium aurum TaxID=1791 RepID=A0A3S5EJC9_MYCAU|nr:SigB/SigF/SigG family RNA polymerase sigma factor [Mycolicibacterium aurum]VEG54362.1 FliA/WhiG family RNA polymerase sigma factor [Mycolicibacterium aurum]
MTVAERIGERTEAATRRPDWTNIEDQLLSMAECGDAAERRRRRGHIITECLPLADHIAYRFAGRGEPSDDLIQVARIGLVKSVDRYVPGRGRFMAFALPTIRGEVRRHFRDATWSMRVPRRVQETQLRMRRTVEELSQRLNRPPTDPEIARELGVGEDEVAQSQSAHWAYRPVSLDAPRGDFQEGGTSIGESQGVDDPGFDSIEDLIVLREVIAELDPRRRAILGMRFFDCLTQREIALRLNISQVQVSRLLDGTLTRLRQRLYVDVPVVVCLLAPAAVTF